MQVEATINFVRPDPFIKGTIKKNNNNSNVIDFDVNVDEKYENNDTNTHLKECVNKKNEEKKSVTFKIPTKQATYNFHYLVSAVTSACRQVLPNEFTNIINDNIMGLLMSLIAGIMIQISLYELLPTSLKYKNKKT